MPFIDESLDDVQEAKPAAEGEYDLRIIKAERRTSKNGTDMIDVLIGIEGEDAPSFHHYLLSWDSDTPEDQVLNRKREIKRFCAAFDLSTDFDAEDMPGQEARSVFLIQEEGDDGVVRNRMRLPRLKD